MTDSNPTQPGMTPVSARSITDTSENLLRHYVTVIRRRGRWVVAGLVIGLIAGVASTFAIHEAKVTQRYYKATNTLVQNGSSDTSGNGYTLNQAALQIQSAALLDEVGSKVHMSREQVAAQVTATVRPNVNAIDVTAIATDPDTAETLADQAAASLETMAQKQAGNDAANQRSALETQLAKLKKQREDLMNRIATDPPDKATLVQQASEVSSQISDTESQLENLPASTSGFTLSVLQPASAKQINAKGYNYRYSQNANARNILVNPSVTSSAAPDFDENDLSTATGLSKKTRVALGGAAGLLLGLISAFIVEAWDDRVRRRDAVEELTDLGVLTEVPRLSREQIRNHHVSVEDEPNGVAAERYRSARTAIVFAMNDLHAGGTDEAPVLMVTSPGPAEGKTTTVANLAAAFADDGRRVLVIDGDFRRPAVRRYLTPVPNLVSPDEPCATKIDGVSFLAGPHDSKTPEIAVDLLGRTLSKWRSEYDLVILDTPPILTTNDAVELLGSVDAVLLVLRAGRTRSKAAERVAELLRQFRAETLGIVLNGCDRTEMNQYYGYGYGYSYGYLGDKPSKRTDEADTAAMTES